MDFHKWSSFKDLEYFYCSYQGMVKGYSGIFRLGEATSTWDADSPVCLPISNHNSAPYFQVNMH